jgi:histidinol-phosphate aminotransferase
MKRPNWTTPLLRKSLDLSRNIHYDSELNSLAESALKDAKGFLNYPNEYELYNVLGNFYQIEINRMAIGFGATDLIERILKSLDFDHVYIVEPSFEMVSIYCSNLNKPFSKVTVDTIPEDSNGLLYIANPNGNNGQSIDVRPFIEKFKYVIIDEVYGDFDKTHSLLHDNLKNTIIVKSLSKSLGLAGLRVGFMVADQLITNKVQQVRMNYNTTSLSCHLVKELLSHTDNVIQRMEETKQFLENKYRLIHSHGNYVLFNEPNELTERFGYKLVNGFYRMALLDLNTLYANTSVKTTTK